VLEQGTLERRAKNEKPNNNAKVSRYLPRHYTKEGRYDRGLMANEMNNRTQDMLQSLAQRSRERVRLDRHRSNCNVHVPRDFTMKLL
jgi:hypothetical protein